MEYWYGIMRSPGGKITHKRVAVIHAPTQEEFLKQLGYKINGDDVILELDRGDFMTREDFVKYAEAYYMSDKKITITEIEILIRG